MLIDWATDHIIRLLLDRAAHFYRKAERARNQRDLAIAIEWHSGEEHYQGECDRLTGKARWWQSLGNRIAYGMVWL